MHFPQDDYTPHGYLDTPTHTRNLTPRGVLRSFGAGFRWHYPAHAGTYGGRREAYRAGFRIALDGAVELGDFDGATSPYHTKNVVVFQLARGAARGQVRYHLVGEHALYARVNVTGARRLAICVEYVRLLAANGEWGESGLVGRVVDGELILQGFEDGDALVLWTSQPPSDFAIAPEPNMIPVHAAAPGPRLPESMFVPVVGRRGEQVALYGVLGFVAPPGDQLDIILARGKTVAGARRHLASARRIAEADYARKLAEDNTFWSHAARLAGDWPPHWRRGLVYDLETVRMMVRQPIGIYRHNWDAMQIQAPRVVLAEAAIDALLLGYADPRAAQDLLLGTFADAPEPNVPCSREDGSYNMIAADGTVCGTAPAWGYPWLVLEWLNTVQPDRSWIQRIYPHLAAYLDWWLLHRRDAKGWLGYACSWESGQDDSPRFGTQPLGGGHPVRHIRPVDLHAAFAHACGVMSKFATLLALPGDVTKWGALADEFGGRTEGLWRGEEEKRGRGGEGETSDGGRYGYADVDGRSGRFTEVDDVMLLAPLALGIAPSDRLDGLRRAIQQIDQQSLIWPMFAWTAVAAATAAGLHDKAAELAGAICERAYGFWDARKADPQRTLPGISCEYWPPNGRCGGEGYGWGAFTTHLLLHTLVGITPTHDSLNIRPNLPVNWRGPGHRYSVQLHWRACPLQVTLEPLDEGRVAVTVNERRAEGRWGELLRFPWVENG